jgi:phage anti-repressor protein
MNTFVPETVNFAELVKNNKKLTVNVKNKMVSIMNETFEEEEQRWYVANLYMYMNYHQTDEYPIDLNDVFTMIGFVNKANAKKTLKNNFTEGSDYQTLLIRRDEQKLETRGGSNNEKIMMNVDTFKNMCMIARTEKGKEIRKYYVKMENINNKMIEEAMKEQVKEIEIENKQQVLLREYSKECSLVYLMRVATLYDNCYILKIGESRAGVLGRYKEHSKKYGECILMDCFIVRNSKQLEKFIHGRFSPYKYKDLVDHETENELFMIGKDLTYQMVVNTIKENLHTYDNINTESESSLKLQIEKLQLENENLKLQAQIPANIDYDMIRNLIKEELRNNAPQNVTNNFNEVLPTVGPRVQQINPENMSLIQVYENVSEVLTKWRIPRSSLTKACKENTIYKDFRWNFVERDLDANDVSGVQPTKKLSKEYNLGYIAKTNLTKTEVIAVYLDRKTASMCNNYNSVAFLDNYVKNAKECDGHYYILFEKLSDEVKQAFLDKHNITTEICLYKSGVGKFTESGELLAEFRSKYHLQQELKIGEKSLNKALITGKSYNGYLFKKLEEKVCLT